VSNVQLPTPFYYENIHLASQTEEVKFLTNGMERFGNWLEHKLTEYDEIKELEGAGQGREIFK
jgi:hypothetical protein